MTTKSRPAPARAAVVFAEVSGSVFIGGLPRFRSETPFYLFSVQSVSQSMRRRNKLRRGINIRSDFCARLAGLPRRSYAAGQGRQWLPSGAQAEQARP